MADFTEPEPARGRTPTREPLPPPSAPMDWRDLNPRPDSPLASRQTRRKWPWIAGIVIAVVLALAAGLVLVAFHETALTHDLVDADFDSTPDPFGVGENDVYAYEVFDGAYRISAKTGNPTEPASSGAWFARTAGFVEAEATVVEVPGSTGGVGIGCVAESAEGVFDGGFWFVVGDGQGALLDVWSGDGFDDAEPMTLHAGQRIGITCASEFLTMDGTVQATIDGEVVLERSNGNSDGFNRLTLLFYPASEDDSVVFDNVVAEVP